MVYPNVDWQVWRFSHTPKGFWDRPEAVESYLKWVSDKLGLSSLDDWNFVTSHYINTLKGGSLLRRSTLMSNLSKIYPQHSFKPANTFGLNKSQAILVRKLQNLFPDEDVRVNYKTPEFTFGTSKFRMEHDIYLPSYSLVIEYQGQQHYKDNWFLFGCSQDVQSKDQEKKEAFNKAGLTLVHIPFWWDLTTESLAGIFCLY